MTLRGCLLLTDSRLVCSTGLELYLLDDARQNGRTVGGGPSGGGPTSGLEVYSETMHAATMRRFTEAV